jgi:hypothetical protein
MMVKTIQKPKPSKTLDRKIDACVTGYKRLGNLFLETLEQGRKEGFKDLEIGNMIKARMLKAGIHIQTILKYLPSTAKAKPRGNTTPDKIKANSTKSRANTVTKEEKQDISNLAMEMLTGANKEEDELPLPKKSRFDEMEEEEEREKQEAQTKGSIRMDDSEIWECDSWPIESFTMRDVNHYTLAYIKKAHKQIGEVIKELEQKEKLK